MTHVIGLTGSIGMGKTTTAKLFADRGIPVWDADDAVHQLYAKGGAAVAPIKKQFPNAIKDGAVNRPVLREIIQNDPSALTVIEGIVHPLVQKSRAAFVEKTGAPIVLIDIPLLFETGAQSDVDSIVCVSVSPETQRNRVLARGIMSEDMFQKILSKQVPDAEKRRQSDFVIETNTLEEAATAVDSVLNTIRQGLRDA